MKIVVLAGGNSTERDVSLISGMGVYHALKERGHQVVLLDVYLGVSDEDAKDAFTSNRDWSAGIKAISALNPDLEEIKAMKKGDKNFFGKNVIELACRRISRLWRFTEPTVRTAAFRLHLIYMESNTQEMITK